MKHKNIKGFTLIEMLVVIAVIGALSVAIGVSANQMMENSQKNDYEETYKEIMKNARIYVEIEDSITLIKGQPVAPFSLQTLIDKGLQDENILFKKNPALSTDLNFSGSMQITVSLTDEGKKNVSISAGTCTITNENINDFEWGKC